jgi:hypothetical protein
MHDASSHRRALLAEYPPGMSEDANALPDEVSASSHPVAWARGAARKIWLPAALLVVVLVALGIVCRHSLSWGDVPTWILAITTLLALLAATFAGLVAYELLRVENARDQAASVERSQTAADRRQAEAERAAQREADRRSQANKVTAWFDFYRAGVPRDQYYPGSPAVATAPTTWGAAIHNASELPIFDVRVFFYWVNDPGDSSPWAPDLRYTPLERFRVIPPNYIRHFDLPATVQNTGEECNDNAYVVGIEFTDASGARWMRDARGVLLDLNGSV